MIRSQLNSYSGSDPIWGFVALVRSERFTGEAAVGIDPRVRLFAVDGRIYFAEREGDAPIGTRLVNYGAVTSTQLEHGAVRIGESSSLARLFQRDPTIDRDAVELTIESTTESLLESIANKAVGMPEVFPLRHHSSGIHHWLRVDGPSPTPAVDDAPVVEDTPAFEVEAPFAETHIVFDDTPVAEEAPLAEDAPVVEEATTVVEEEASVLEEAPDFQEAHAAEEEAPAAEEGATALEEAPVAETWSNSWQPDPAVCSMASAPHDETMADVMHESETISAPEPVVAETAEVEMVRAFMPWATGDALEQIEPTPAESFAEAEYDLPDDDQLHDDQLHDDQLHDDHLHDDHLHDDQLHDDAPVIDAPAPIPSPFAMPTPHSAVALPAPTAPWVEEHPHANGVNGHTPHVTIETVTIETATEEQPPPAPIPMLGPIPTLASLTTLASLQRSAADVAPDAGRADSLPKAISYEPGAPPPDLPKLAAAPISMSDLAAANAEPTSPWSGATHNLAAVDIWEMVDDLTIDDQVDDEQLVSSGGADKRGRGWLRGRKD